MPCGVCCWELSPSLGLADPKPLWVRESGRESDAGAQQLQSTPGLLGLLGMLSRAMPYPLWAVRGVLIGGKGLHLHCSWTWLTYAQPLCRPVTHPPTRAPAFAYLECAPLWHSCSHSGILARGWVVKEQSALPILLSFLLMRLCRPVSTPSSDLWFLFCPLHSFLSYFCQNLELS